MNMDTEKTVKEVDCQYQQMGIKCVHKDRMIDGVRVHHEGDHEVLADEVRKKIEDGGFNKPEVILKEDEQKKMSLADFKRWRQRTIGDLNVLLGSLHKELINSQVRTNLMWNTTNAILRAFMNKGLLTEEDVMNAGAELMKEAHENLDRARQAVAEQRQTTQEDYIGTPMDRMKDVLYKKRG